VKNRAPKWRATGTFGGVWMLLHEDEIRSVEGDRLDLIARNQP
jgi:hypothetical protein